MPTLAIVAIIAVSSVLYLALPIDHIRSRVSEQLHEAGGDGKEAFSEFTGEMRRAFSDDTVLAVRGTGAVLSARIGRMRNGMLTVSWMQPHDTGGAIIRLHRGPACDDDTVIYDKFTPSTSVRLPVPPSVKSASVRSGYDTDPGEVVCIPIDDIEDERTDGVPDAPSDVTVTGHTDGDNRVRVQWQPPDDESIRQRWIFIHYRSASCDGPVHRVFSTHYDGDDLFHLPPDELSLSVRLENRDGLSDGTCVDLTEAMTQAGLQ